MALALVLLFVVAEDIVTSILQVKNSCLLGPPKKSIWFLVIGWLKTQYVLLVCVCVFSFLRGGGGGAGRHKSLT